MSLSFRPVAYSIAWLAPCDLGLVMRQLILLRPCGTGGAVDAVCSASAVAVRRTAIRRGADLAAAAPAPRWGAVMPTHGIALYI